ncbi:MAG: Thioesterase 1/protease 1/lysophospholipase L1 [Candidatus Celerinatantimonas neptuna]|nr:MAG: Thioesterase 1/protease 1/lysophospholipase L1 [Candidatus Celerinatantimonas neptuna]
MRVEQSWPELLKEKLPHIDIINASSSGETSSGGARRLSILLEQYHPQWCLLELGGNDGLQGLPTNLLRQQLTKMITQAKKAKCNVILTEIKLPPNYGNRYTTTFNQVYHHLAHQFKIPLMPFFVEAIYKRQGMMQNDGIHPSAKAQPIIAMHVARFIKQLIKNKTGK